MAHYCTVERSCASAGLEEPEGRRPLLLLLPQCVVLPALMEAWSQRMEGGFPLSCCIPASRTSNDTQVYSNLVPNYSDGINLMVLECIKKCPLCIFDGP